MSDRFGMERAKKPLQLAGHEPAADSVPEALPQFADAGFAFTETRIIDVPRATLERTRVVTPDAPPEVAGAYKLLRTQVLQRLQARNWQTIAIVSPAAGEGKTLTAINLAIALATTRTHTALLVDLDWRQPSVHSHFDYTPTRDVYDYLRGDASLSEALVSPGLARFTFLPCREPVSDASEYLGSLGPFVKELKSRYANRIVLFDLPPLLVTDDALSFLPLVDGALLVVEEGRTKRDEVARSLALIGEERLLGSVINKSDQRLPRY
jgi:Mrp family chromosome partitioning ATPase